MTAKDIPIDTRPLFKLLHTKLMHLLKSLDVKEWSLPTVAKKWCVKDVVSHILDTKLRVLSIQRDGYFGEVPPEMHKSDDLIDWINKLNADWVQATRRLSPGILMSLLDSLGKEVADYYSGLDPWEESIFPVAWAGQTRSYNWMHVAREYTEYWHHQQQIRDAVNKQGIMTREFFFPVMDTFFQALPHTFRNVEAEEGLLVKVTITSELGGHWFIERTDSQWKLVNEPSASPSVIVTIPYELSWQLFSKSLRPEDVQNEVRIVGDQRLGKKVLEMVAVMA